MHANSMVDRSDPTITIAATIRRRLQGVSIGQVVVIVLVFLVETLLVLGFVAMSLGLGADDQAGVGPDRPPPPARMP